MASLHIKSFGPIVDSTRIELTPLMVLIGRQSAGKSAFMKVLCFCRWIEKKMMVSTDDMVNQYTHYNRFVKTGGLEFGTLIEACFGEGFGAEYGCCDHSQPVCNVCGECIAGRFCCRRKRTKADCCCGGLHSFSREHLWILYRREWNLPKHQGQRDTHAQWQ